MRKIGWLASMDLGHSGLLLACSLSLLLVGCPTPDVPDAGEDGGPPPADSGRDAGPSVCERAADCDDGSYCNGIEACEPGGASSDERGCAPGEPPCEAPLMCNEASRTCEMDCSEPDADGDGHDRIGCGAGDDCDDNDSDRFPGNPEVCDAEGHDEDCDPDTLSGVPDADGDGHVSAMCCNGDVCGTDCDDTNPDVKPGATETCNGVDDDCDGVIDGTVGGPGPVGVGVYFEDLDGDGYGNPDRRVEACTPPEGWVLDNRDCWDGSDLVRPNQTQFFNRPVCRNGMPLGNGPPVLCPSSEPDCWTCGDRRAEPPDFDYDCSGGAEPRAAVDCYVLPPGCEGGRGPDNTELPAMCGLRVDFIDCRDSDFGGCNIGHSRDRLPCR